MKIQYSALAMIAGLSLATGAFAQTPPSGGPDAKGNAPLKPMHTVNDGAAKKGANSFTQNEARKHIMNSGYTGVSPLTKGKDGVWRGTAMKGGASLNVALDFKGNVSEGGPVGPGSMSSTDRPTTVSVPAAKPMADPAMAAAATSGPMANGAGAKSSTMHHHRRHHHHHHMMANCANPGPNGVACSGQDRNKNGISDKEDRAIKAGEKP